jgi:hypothetical protein
MDAPDRSRWPTRLSKLHDEDEEERDYLASLSDEERLKMVWTLTVQAWGFKEGRSEEPRLRRDVVDIERGRSREPGVRSADTR